MWNSQTVRFLVPRKSDLFSGIGIRAYNERTQMVSSLRISTHPLSNVENLVFCNGVLSASSFVHRGMEGVKYVRIKYNFEKRLWHIQYDKLGRKVICMDNRLLLVDSDSKNKLAYFTDDGKVHSAGFQVGDQHTTSINTVRYVGEQLYVVENVFVEEHKLNRFDHFDVRVFSLSGELIMKRSLKGFSSQETLQSVGVHGVNLYLT